MGSEPRRRTHAAAPTPQKGSQAINMSTAVLPPSADLLFPMIAAGGPYEPARQLIIGLARGCAVLMR